jgi:hypothetical protein
MKDHSKQIKNLTETVNKMYESSNDQPSTFPPGHPFGEPVLPQDKPLVSPSEHPREIDPNLPDIPGLFHDGNDWGIDTDGDGVNDIIIIFHPDGRIKGFSFRS